MSNTKIIEIKLNDNQKLSLPFQYTNRYNLDIMIILGFIVGIVLGILLMFYENPILIVLTTAAFAVAGIRLLTDSVGSFVDAYQGINMFGDATQVGNIISMTVLIMIGVVASLVSSFLKRVKE